MDPEIDGEAFKFVDIANYLQNIMDNMPFPALLPNEHEKLDEARAVVLRLRTLEEKR